MRKAIRKLHDNNNWITCPYEVLDFLERDAGFAQPFFDNRGGRISPIVVPRF